MRMHTLTIILFSILSTFAIGQLAVPSAEGQLAVPSAAEEAPSSGACNCTSLGYSGNTYVDGRIGCGQHLLNISGDNSYFCYVIDPAKCPQGNISSAFSGSAWRYCNPSTDATQQLTIFDIIGSVPELSTLSLALQQPSVQPYASQLKNASSSSFTVFAPTNAAFNAAFEVLGISSPQDFLNSSSLIPLLLLHVASGNYSTQLIKNSTAPIDIQTLSPSLFSNVSVKYVRRFARRRGSAMSEPTNILLLDAIVYDSNAASGLSVGTYSLRPFAASNGVVYMIDNVIALRDDVATSIENSPDFKIFSRALNDTGLFASALGYGACPAANGTCNVTDITVWAPVDAAWLSLAASLNTTVEDLLNSTALPTILEYHISPMTQQPGGGLNLTFNQSIPTLLSDQNITFVNATRTVPVVSSPIFGTIFAEVSGPVLSGNAPDNYASIDRSATIEAYNGMVVPISSILLPGNVSGLMTAAASGGIGGMAPAVEGAMAPGAEGVGGVAAPNNY